MPSFSGKCPRIVIPALSSPPIALILSSRRNGPTSLEPHGTFVNLHAVQFCNSVQQVRSRHAACSAQFVSARFEQIIEGETQNMIRVDKRSIAVENSKTISVAVGREPGQSVFFDYSFLKQPEISF